MLEDIAALTSREPPLHRWQKGRHVTLIIIRLETDTPTSLLHSQGRTEPCSLHGRWASDLAGVGSEGSLWGRGKEGGVW